LLIFLPGIYITEEYYFRKRVEPLVLKTMPNTMAFKNSADSFGNKVEGGDSK
jgi:hypothetical protein